MNQKRDADRRWREQEIQRVNKEALDKETADHNDVATKKQRVDNKVSLLVVW